MSEENWKRIQRLVGVKDDGKPGPMTAKAILNKLLKKETQVEPTKEYSETYCKSPNQSFRLTAPKFIVLHHSFGSHDGTKSWILNDRSNVSYHYLIDNDGSRTQFVYDSKKAWHAGPSSYGNYVGLNSHSIGISFYGNTHERTPNNLEIDSCAKKCIYLMDKFSIPLENIITHQMCAPKRKKDCSNETYQLVLTAIKELL